MISRKEQDLLAAAPASEEAYISFDPKREKGFNPNTRLLTGQVYETHFYVHENQKMWFQKRALRETRRKNAYFCTEKSPN